METVKSVVVRPLTEEERIRLAGCKTRPWLRYSRNAAFNALENHTPRFRPWGKCSFGERLEMVKEAERCYLLECREDLDEIALSWSAARYLWVDAEYWCSSAGRWRRGSVEAPGQPLWGWVH